MNPNLLQIGSKVDCFAVRVGFIDDLCASNDGREIGKAVLEIYPTVLD